MITLTHYLVLAVLLFVIGATGFLMRRNIIIILLSVELMLNAVNINLVAFSYFLKNPAGQVFVFFVMTIAAAEATLGLAIVVALYRNLETVFVDEINQLKG
ncbi:MAG: NADH-quinone oxidoreductase subunit NuoK [bacterium]|nr:NADH-quinone oxidoreductase subunit NuoK [bacterium]MDT8395447.1 NADH-quinone oxidoreductase subunit NuoK [bacterium]